jgi:hypothetical protein
VAYRLTTEAFAERLGVAVRTVAKWDAQPDMVQSPALQQALDSALEQAPLTVRSRLSLLLTGGTVQGGIGAAAGDGCVQAALGAMQAFRAADLRVGGGHLYPAVIGYLRDELAPSLVDGAGTATVFTAAAAITEMAGWMAHDAGRDTDARQHFGRALDLIRAGQDRRLHAHILASMSHLEEHLDNPGAAITLARSGRAVLAGGPCNPDLDARLYALEARACASLGSAPECTALLAKAEHALVRPPDEEPSSWVAGFDEASLANEAARGMRHLGDLAEVRRQTSRITALRPASRPRSRAFGQLILATALAAEGLHEEACVITAGVLDSTPAIGSNIVIQQLSALSRLLQAHREAAQIADLLARIDRDIRQREWVFSNLGDASSLPPSHGADPG